MSIRNDITGRSFGRIHVIGYSHTCAKKSYWSCKCSCGKEWLVRGTHLTGGKIVSCGCYAAEQASVRKKTHGMSKTVIYKVWSEIIQRCCNPNSTVFKDYGGRGITVCDRWRESFDNFYTDMGDRPRGKEIDRIKNHLGYSPDNCRWITHQKNCNNKRSNVIFAIGAETKTLKEWAVSTGTNYKRLWKRVKDGWPIEKALSRDNLKPWQALYSGLRVI